MNETSLQLSKLGKAEAAADWTSWEVRGLGGSSKLGRGQCASLDFSAAAHLPLVSQGIKSGFSGTYELQPQRAQLYFFPACS